MKTTTHPTLPWTLNFNPTVHLYTDQDGRPYESVTKFISRHFAPFDEPAALTRQAAATGRLEMDIVAEWRRKRDQAAEFGKRVHAYAESLVLGTTPPAPTDEADARALRIVDRALATLAHAYEFLGAEVMVFDPLYLLAGTIDLPARNKLTGALAILDWKTCESITSDAYGKRALPPIDTVPDSKVNHYALQLSTYAWLLTAPGYTAYPSEGEPVELAMIHIPHIGEDPVWRPLPYLADEVTRMVQAAADARYGIVGGSVGWDGQGSPVKTPCMAS